MEHPEEFKKLLLQVMSRECKPTLSEEEIHFDVLSMKVIEVVGAMHHRAWPIFDRYCRYVESLLVSNPGKVWADGLGPEPTNPLQVESAHITQILDWTSNFTIHSWVLQQD